MKTLIKLIGLSIGMLLLFASCEKEYPYPQIKEKQSIKIDRNRISKTKAYIDDDVYIFSPYEKEEEGKQTEEDQNKKPQDKNNGEKKQEQPEEPNKEVNRNPYAPKGLFCYKVCIDPNTERLKWDGKYGMIEICVIDNSLYYTRVGSSAYYEGYLEAKRKLKVCKYGLYTDIVEYSYDSKTLSYNLTLPPKGTKAYLEMYKVRDIISIRYNKEDDSLLVKVKTPINKGDGKQATYKLIRANKSCSKRDLDF